METTSVHVDKYGTVLKNINDGDNHVYEHDNAKTTADVDKTYSKTNTGAGGKDIGELGGKIDVSTILKNDLQRDGKIADGLTHNDEEDEMIITKCKGDSVYTAKTKKTSSKPEWDIPKVLETKTYSLKDLKEEHKFE